MLIELIQLIFAMAHVANGIIYFHCYKMLQNVGAIHWSLFNNHCYRMWVQFITSCSMGTPYSMVPTQNVSAVHWSLFNGHSLFKSPCSKCGCNSLIPLEWSTLQNVGAIHWSLFNGLMNSLINSSLSRV
jgi:hypothetical protein